jgi:peptidoglycan biosynthesis protein MviN/MurJ (putative lipid II flippase)
MTTTVLIVLIVWTLVAMLFGWVIAQCISSMNEPDQIEVETAALLKRINGEMK